MKIKAIFTAFLVVFSVAATVYSCLPFPYIPEPYTPEWHNKVLYLGLTPRASSMAKTFTAISNDSTAFYWNPAGAVNISKMMLSYNSSHNYYKSIEADIGSTEASFIFPLAGCTIGINFNETKLTPKNLSEFPAWGPSFYTGADTFSFLAACRINNRFSFGLVANQLTEKFYSHNNDIMEDSNIGMNAGVMYEHEKFSMGISVNHLRMDSIYSEDINPAFVKIGAARNLNKLLLAADVEIHSNYEYDPSIGAEYNISDMLFLRAGYKFKNYSHDIDDTENLNYGLGLKISGFMLDYSASPNSPLELTQRLSLSTSF